MKLHFAGNSGSVQRERDWQKILTNRLLSFYYIKLGNFAGPEAFDMIKQSHAQMKKNKPPIDLFLDSGAFSAYTQGVEIDIQEYIEFIREHESVIEAYSNLDVISTDKIGNKQSAEDTLKNQRIMESAGLSPVPVFHYGEPVEYLEQYIADYDYISLGGMVPISTPQLIPWLDELWAEHLTDDKGMPKVKVHGFGLTSLRLMVRYPWYSVDSTSWVVTGRMGSIYVPRYKNGQWIYNEDSWKIVVSNKSPERKSAGKHIDTFPPIQKKIILEYIHSMGHVLGVSEFKKVNPDYVLQENERWAEKKPKDPEEQRKVEVIIEPGVSNKYQYRDDLNIKYFMELARRMKKYPWAFEKQSPVKTLF